MRSSTRGGVAVWTMQEKSEREEGLEPPPEDRPDEPGAEGGSRSPAADQPPALPSDDQSPFGDSDQHSEG